MGVAQRPFDPFDPRHAEAKEAAYVLSRFVNRGSKADFDAFVEFMGMDHRTLQQTFTQVCLLWFRHLAELPDNMHDLRNEHSVKVAKLIRERLEAEWGSAWSHTPLI